MIELTSGDILKDDSEAIVNTVNCVGIMGRGIALQFKNAWPENFKAYEAACLREDFAFLGLIGSESKREAISRQLVHRGLHPERLDDLTCPIGIPGIEGKHPAAIAASVAAQILQVRETRMAIGHATHPGPDVPPLSSLPRPQ